jgi:hypothetical protein
MTESASSRFIQYQIQGCQMVYFQTKNPNLGKFWRALELYGHLECFTDIWDILPMAIWYSLIFYDHFVFIWNIFPVLVSCT